MPEPFDPLDPDGRWITVNGQRIHVTKGNEIDGGGHPKLREALSRGGLTEKKPDGCRNETRFPESPDAVEDIKRLGGSTGARLVRYDGQKFVLKRGASPDHVREEEACNDMYRAAGVTVQDSKLYETPAGPVRLSHYMDKVVPLRVAMDGKTGDEKARVLASVRRGFAADALFGNWDVIGLEYDNVMVAPDGQAVRIDNGGSLRYRAQGELKNDKIAGAWGPAATDADTLRGIGRGSRSSASVFGGMTDAEVGEQVKDLLGRRAAILSAAPDHLRDTIDARLKWMADRFKVAAPAAAAREPAAAPAYHARDLHAEGVWPVPPARKDGTPARRAYGGVVFDPAGRVLLREPKGHFDGYHWTFAKGGAQPGENPHDVAHREVTEETGHAVEVIGHVPGRHATPSSSSYFYLMRSKGESAPHDAETQSLRWATPEEARALIGETVNEAGRARDLALLDAAVKAHAATGPAEHATPAARDRAYWNAVVAFDAGAVTRLDLFAALDAAPGMTQAVALAVLDAARPA
mgnify:CR=1 FL=1